jgi:hypothetical protein
MFEYLNLNSILPVQLKKRMLPKLISLLVTSLQAKDTL